MQSQLHILVASLVKDTSPEDWRRIALATGLKFSWIKSFAEKRIPAPSAVRLELLYEGLTGKPVKFKK